MKKLKSLSAASVPSLIEELSRLNLSKFVEEMAAGIAETKLKPSDVVPIVDLCAAIASRYSKFPELLLAEIKKGLPLKRTDKISNAMKLRIDVRFVYHCLFFLILRKHWVMHFFLLMLISAVPQLPQTFLKTNFLRFWPETQSTILEVLGCCANWSSVVLLVRKDCRLWERHCPLFA